jgi:hypothetical protein
MIKSMEAHTKLYLVRLARDGRHGPWRASLHNVCTGEQVHFIPSEGLWTYLQAEMAGEAQPVNQPARSRLAERTKRELTPEK